MHPHLRRLSAALALVIPLVLTATAAVALDTSSTALPPVQTGASSGTVRADTSAEDHGEMSDSEHAQSEPEHGEMSDSEHAKSESEPEPEHAPEAGPRPRALVLGSFGLVNAGIVVSAAVLRRGTSGRQKHRSSARATAPTAP